ncbi:MAG TPA: ABC transporter permease [Candidatus Deferrimicrobium sp.]|nr:ABC transporter permease [Candidatus Deferrimicrobium sp.]
MKLKVLIQREFLERVRNKTYIFTTLIGLLVILGLSFLPTFKDMIQSSNQNNIVILAQSEEIAKFLNEQLQDKLPNGEREMIFKAVTVNASEWADKKKTLMEDLIAGRNSVLVEVSPPDAPNGVIWHAKKIDMGGVSSKVQGALQQLAVQQRTQASGLSSSELAAIFAPMDFQTRAEGLKAATAEQQTQNMMLVYFLLFMLYFSLIVYGMYVANGVIEEKSSRVIEMMIATVKPTTMMAAKIIGIGAVGLTQYFIWIAAGIGLLSLKGEGLSLMPGMSFKLAAVDPMYLIYFGIFFVLGFLIYAAMYAGIGATVSRAEDTNQAVSPMTFLIVIGFMLAMYSLFNPDNPWIVALSYFPFFTPMVLFSRIVLTPVPPLSIMLGILDMLVSISILIWLAGKLYRTGVLMYGKVSLKDIVKLIRTS